jgi:hypothetical protein
LKGRKGKTDQSDKPKKQRTHCNKQGHDVRECWKLNREQEAQPPTSSSSPNEAAAKVTHAPSTPNDGVIRLSKASATTPSRAYSIAGDDLLTTFPAKEDDFSAAVKGALAVRRTDARADTKAGHPKRDAVSAEGPH